MFISFNGKYIYGLINARIITFGCFDAATLVKGFYHLTFIGFIVPDVYLYNHAGILIFLVTFYLALLLVPNCLSCRK